MMDSHSGIQLLLTDEEISDDKMCLFIKVLAKAVSCDTGKPLLLDLLTTVFSSKFTDILRNFHIDNLMDFSRKDVSEILSDELIILSYYIKIMPHHAKDKAPKILKVIQLIILKLSEKMEGLDLVSQEVEELLKSLESCQTKADPFVRKGKDLTHLDDIDPIDNFRDIRIEPTAADLDQEERAFVRRNKVEGAYKSVETYLDVQFRLMREDFIRPLRNGLRDFKQNSKNHGDVRVYKNAGFLFSKVKFGKLIHYVEIPWLLKVKKNQAAAAKRLMYGNLLCLSNDHFKSFIWAIVSSKSHEEFKQGIVGIEMLFDSKLSRDLLYIVLEPDTYFVAYKHVLTALQQVDANTLPFKEHIVDVVPEVPLPTFLQDKVEAVFDLRVVRDIKLMKPTNYPMDSLFPIQPTVSPDSENGDVSLSSVNLKSSLVDWPPCNTFGLDHSQLEALHGALTKRLALIQGPPGTGKTFLGLKIVQILLHNSKYWKEMNENVEIQQPILVVCYTNHALDQFLEGMESFTQRIVRIGNRSKSERMEQYQINKMVTALERQKSLPSYLYFGCRDAERKARNDGLQYNLLQQVIEKINSGLGLIKLQCFIDEKILPQSFCKQLSGSSFLEWLLPYGELKQAKKNFHRSDNSQSVTRKSSIDETECVDGQFWDELLEYRNQEYCDRFVDDEDVEEDLEASFKSSKNPNDVFEITVESIELRLKKLRTDFEDKKLSRKDFNIKSSHFENQKALMQVVCSQSSPNNNLLHWCSSDERKNIDIYRFSFDQRRGLYAAWVQMLKRKYATKLEELEKKLKNTTPVLEQFKTSKYLFVARQADVIGMTTTAAASYQAMLQDLKPKIGQ